MTHRSILSACTVALALFFFSSNVHAQSRELGAQSLILDDNAGHRLRIMAPMSGWPAPGLFDLTLPVPPSGMAAGFVQAGNADNTFLKWNTAGYWQATPQLPGALGLGTPNTVTMWNGAGNGLTNSSITETGNLIGITNNTLVVSGITGGSVPSGAGTRLVWSPTSAALRAGVVEADQWDASNIGYASIAFGRNTIASGDYSLASGEGSVASGDYTLAVGPGATASEIGAIALGESTTASGPASVAIGLSTTASGSKAIAMGTSVTASGTNSVALGSASIATGQRSVGLGGGHSNADYAFATGFSADANGIASFVGGYSVTANGNYATAFGNGSQAAGEASFAAGSNSIASGFAAVAIGSSVANAESAVAVGSENQATGVASTALGFHSTASAPKSVAIGVTAEASGINAVAVGPATTASGNSAVALGFNSTASGVQSFTLGAGVLASGDHSVALGNNASTSGYAGAFVYGDNSNVTDITSTAENQFSVRAAGGYQLFTDADLTTGVYMSSGDNSWSSVSDSNRKTRRLSISGDEVLNKLSQMWLGSWNYKTQPSTKRHYGPMAQEFFAAFGHDGIGIIGNDTTLATADVDGVTLIAVKALIERNDALTTRVELLEAMIRKMAGSQDTTIQKALFVK